MTNLQEVITPMEEKDRFKKLLSVSNWTTEIGKASKKCENAPIFGQATQHFGPKCEPGQGH